MKLIMTSATWIGLAASMGSVPLLAQMQNNTEKQMTCDNGGNNGDQARHCEIRELPATAIGRLNVDGGQNGGATVKGWTRGDVLVRARVEARGDTEGAAANMASRVNIDTSGGQVRATGPESVNNSGWSVSYEIFVPQNTDLTVKSNNGGLTISDVRGQIRFTGTNGGVHLKRVAGDVSGNTVNGGVQVELAGAVWDGRQLEVSTTNGGVTLAMPAHYSARVQAETSNGGLHSDFASPLDSKARTRKLDFSVGAGGPLIHVTTQNGGVTVKKVEAQ